MNDGTGTSLLDREAQVFDLFLGLLQGFFDRHDVEPQALRPP
jgi:hypothetical protein